MGRITNLQHQVGQLQTQLAEKNKVIAQIASRDKKIKDAIKVCLSSAPVGDTQKLLTDIAVLL